MRSAMDFPDGFGSDPTLMFGPGSGPGSARLPPAAPAPPEPAPAALEPPPLWSARLDIDEAHRPGPFRAHYDSGLKPDLHAGRGDITLDPRGFHLGGAAGEASGDAAGRREPQGFVVTTVIVGLILAAMGYFLDLH